MGLSNMDAQVYLRSLRENVKPRVPAPIEQILERRSRQLNIEKEEARAILTKYDGLSFDGLEMFLKDVLIEPFLDILPPQVSQELRSVPMGVLPTFNPNALAIQVPGNGPLIVLHSELLAAVSFYNELQLLAGRLLSKQKIGEAVQLLHSGHGFVVGCFGMERSLNYPILPDLPSSTDYDRVQMKTLANELFIIAHEFAHVHLGHLRGLATMPLVTRDNSVVVNVYNRNQQMELDADVQAVEWLARLRGRGTQKGALALPSVSVAMAVEVLMLVHVVEVNIPRNTRQSSHPPAIQRLQHILNDCPDILETDDKEFIADMMNDALDTESFRTDC